MSPSSTFIQNKKLKSRLDVLLHNRNLAPSRERARAMIMAGQVLIQDEPAIKPGHFVSNHSEIRVLPIKNHPYVSRGGLKLIRAIESFNITVQNKTALDVGASTGGFTDVLLQNQASKVFAIDVGHNQLDWAIRSHPRVKVREGLNARHLKFNDVGEKVDIITMDVSFISVTKILPALIAVSHSETDWIVLIKPQFEIGREKVGKGGIVKSKIHHQEVIDSISAFAESLGLLKHGLIESPITGAKGNKEFLIHWKSV